MKILKQFFSVLFVLLCVVGTGYAATFDGVRELVSRRAPWLGKHIQFKEIASSDGDCFILQTVGKKLVVQATGANAAAVGVNWYLKYYCHRSMSHLGDQLAPVTELPVIGQPVTVKTTSIYRYALNYCTFNYTMSFYDWDDWQWELDWHGTQRREPDACSQRLGSCMAKHAPPDELLGKRDCRFYHRTGL